MMDNLPASALLGDADVDRLSAMVHTLLTEVVVLSERVSALESVDGDKSTQAQQRIDELTTRVLHPFTS